MDRHITVAEQLLDAVTENDIGILRAILEQDKGGESSDGCLLAATNDDIRDALCRASECGSDEAMLLLLFSKFSDNTKQKYTNNSNKDHDSPLHDAMRVGNLQVGEVLIKKCRFNPNQLNFFGKAPLFYAAQRCRKGNSFEMCEFLLKNGANPNRGRGNGEDGVFRPLYAAVKDGMTRIVSLLIVKHGVVPSVTDVSAAICGGRVEILSILFKHGGSVGNDNDNRDDDSEAATTSLNELLHSRDRTRSPAYNRETKLSVCRLLVDHAKQSREEEEDRDTIAFLQLTLENEISKAGSSNNDEGVTVLLEAGVDPFPVMNRAVQGGEESVCRLLVRHGVDPFLRQGDGHIDDNGHATAPSPFLAAAYRQDRGGILKAFLEHWDERFSPGGKNSHGDHPIHLLCRDRHVSLQAIKLVVEYYAQCTMKKKRGLFPFQLAAESDSSLDVIFYLVKHSPVALVRPRPSTNNTDDSQESNNGRCDGVSRNDNGAVLNHLPTAHTNDANDATRATCPAESTSSVTIHKQGAQRNRLEDHDSCPSNKKTKLKVTEENSMHQGDTTIMKSTGNDTSRLEEGKSRRLALVVEAQEKKKKEVRCELDKALDVLRGMAARTGAALAALDAARAAVAL